MAVDKAFVVGVLKDWGLALGITLVVFAGWNLLRPGPMKAGSAPGFTLPDLAGQEHALAETAGEVVVLNFWATWCGPCRMEIPELADFHDAHPDVVLWGLSGDERLSLPALAAASERLGITYPVLHDRTGDVFAAYGVEMLPTTVVVARNGEIVATRQGVVNREMLEGFVASAQ